jgi:hypothetical protein
MKLNRGKFWFSFFGVLVALGGLLPLALNATCASCLSQYQHAVMEGKASWWPVYGADIVLIGGSSVAAYMLAQRRHRRRPWLWVLACLPLHVAVVCYLWALEPVSPGGQRELADQVDATPL